MPLRETTRIDTTAPQCACRFGRLCAFHSKYPGDPKPEKTRKPERCSCEESMAAREELVQAASHIAGLLAETAGKVSPELARERDGARRWLETYQGRLP